MNILRKIIPLSGAVTTTRIVIEDYEFTSEEIKAADGYRRIQIHSDKYSNEQIALHLAWIRDEQGLSCGYTGGRRIAPRDR